MHTKYSTLLMLIFSFFWFYAHVFNRKRTHWQKRRTVVSGGMWFEGFVTAEDEKSQLILEYGVRAWDYFFLSFGISLA
jgi:hypothetical protein